MSRELIEYYNSNFFNRASKTNTLQRFEKAIKSKF